MKFWDQWFWSLIFEDLSRVHPFPTGHKRKLLLKNIAIAARVVSIPYPFQHGHGSSWTLYNPSLHLNILMYSIPFLFWIFGKQDETIHSAACKNRLSFVGTVTSGQPVVYARDYLTFILLSHGSNERTLHSCWVVGDIQLLFVAPDSSRWIWIHFVGLSPQEHKLRPVLHSLKRHALQ